MVNRKGQLRSRPKSLLPGRIKFCPDYNTYLCICKPTIYRDHSSRSTKEDND